jgi:DNA-binding XRE family transcriptional regulator
MAVPYVQPQPEPTLSKAVIRAAAFLGLSQVELAQVLGISRATASRLVAGNYLLDPKRPKEWELALLFIRLFRSLDAIVGHGEDARAWLRGPNTAFEGAPAELITSAEGLVRVVHYLDATRGRV